MALWWSTHLRKCNSIVGEAAWTCLSLICDTLPIHGVHRRCIKKQWREREDISEGWINVGQKRKAKLKVFFSQHLTVAHYPTAWWPALQNEGSMRVWGCGYALLVLSPPPQLTHNATEKLPFVIYVQSIFLAWWVQLLWSPSDLSTAWLLTTAVENYNPLIRPPPSLVHMSSQCGYCIHYSTNSG